MDYSILNINFCRGNCGARMGNMDRLYTLQEEDPEGITPKATPFHRTFEQSGHPVLGIHSQLFHSNYHLFRTHRCFEPIF